ncbi:alpha/beta hydrolase [Luteibacter aegosomatis]|uniref:alpha/beta hydrolase n=1 Tax=Luteibacter aegosomatis TaxID=2911537 RepID=UPI001FF928D7|nr:alpha/beta hydrolase [Luteibacter aegosomatis]UPG87721.1 alpha/beta hydrolase [Luteibacter aegosomatis]
MRRTYVVAGAAWVAWGLAGIAHGAHEEARPAEARVMHDVAYGSDPRQRFDVYLPPSPRHAPVIFMVHGGAWAIGDKTGPGVVDSKAAYWLPKNYVLVSVNYRLLPDAKPLEQSGDVARALAAAQRLAASWGADPQRFVLMGHSAGAHLVALLGADPERLAAAGAVRPRGVVSLDSAAMDVVQIMEFPRHPRLYDRAFGENPRDWAAVSPYQQLRSGALPMLAVCSSRRFDACPQARRLAQKAATLGARVDVLPQDLSHAEINRTLGQPSDYTARVDAFIEGLVAP